ncbi:hypothetical protein AHiyo8_00970 [Arthrobacter sp. Hiyo8]|nr:hypothetical protein AHiyo8_00970 [Arthrobacter sp. Hiyo8]
MIPALRVFSVEHLIQLRSQVGVAIAVRRRRWRGSGHRCHDLVLDGMRRAAAWCCAGVPRTSAAAAARRFRLIRPVRIVVPIEAVSRRLLGEQLLVGDFRLALFCRLPQAFSGDLGLSRILLRRRLFCLPVRNNARPAVLVEEGGVDLSGLARLRILEHVAEAGAWHRHQSSPSFGSFTSTPLCRSASTKSVTSASTSFSSHTRSNG